MNGGKHGAKAKQNNMPIRRLAIAFSIFLIIVIIIADLGYLRFIFKILNRVPRSDNILHFILIGTLTYLITASLIETFPLRSHTVITIISMAVLGFIFTLEEVSQAPLRTRDASLADLLSNYAGILFFGFLAWRRYRKRL